MLGWTVSHFWIDTDRCTIKKNTFLFYFSFFIYNTFFSLFLFLLSFSASLQLLSSPLFFFLSLEPPPLPFSCFFFFFALFFLFCHFLCTFSIFFFFFFFPVTLLLSFFFPSNTEHTNIYIKLLPSPLFYTHAPPWSRFLTSCGSRAVQRWWKLELRPWEIQRLERGLGET